MSGEKFKMEVVTDFTKLGQVEQQTILTQDDMTTVLSRRVVDLQEEGIKNALIALGWIPPEGKSCDGCIDFKHGNCTDIKGHYCIRGNMMEDRYTGGPDSE